MMSSIKCLSAVFLLALGVSPALAEDAKSPTPPEASVAVPTAAIAVPAKPQQTPLPHDTVKAFSPAPPSGIRYDCSDWEDKTS